MESSPTFVDIGWYVLRELNPSVYLWVILIVH